LFADEAELIYSRRPSMTAARAAVGRRTDGSVLEGDTRQVADQLRRAGIPCRVVDDYQPLPEDAVNVVFEPVTPG
jgi:hypothetical protein